MPASNHRCLVRVVLLVLIYVAGIYGQGSTGSVSGPILFVADHEQDTHSRLISYRGSGQDIFEHVEVNESIPFNLLFASPDNSEKTALSFDYDESVLVWSDPGHRAIYAGSMVEGNIRQVFAGTSAFVEGVAVDWLANNIYWTDAAYNWIKMSNYAGSHVRTLVTTGLDSPAGIACDPINGYLYWSDWGDDYKIERSTLSGEDRVVLVDEKAVGSDVIGQPMALAIDHSQNMLYWTDSLGHRVVSLDLNDVDAIPQTFASGQSDFGEIFSLDLDPDFGLFVADRMNDDILLLPFEGSVVTSPHSYKPNAVLYYDKSRQPGEDSPCDTAGCSQLCVSDSTGPICMCSTGFQLETNVTCIPDESAIHDHELIFSSEDDKLCKMPANIGHKPLPQRFNVSCFTELTVNAIDFDVYGNFIYAHSTMNLQNTIMRVRLREGETWSVIVDSTDARGIAVDWIASNVYWSDRRTQSIVVAKVNGDGVTDVLEIGEDHEPGGMVIHAVKRFLFWSVIGRHPGIERSSLSGSDRKVIVNMPEDGPNIPQHLAIDFNKDRLYWADDGTHRIDSVDFEGNDRQNFAVFEPNAQFSGITIFQDFLFLAETEETQIIIYDLTNKRRLRIITLSEKPTALKFFHQSLQPLSEAADQCDTFTCRADQICINTNNGAECLCPRRSRRCIPVRRCPLEMLNGRMNDNCVNLNGQYCSAICDDGYRQLKRIAPRCAADGQWNTNIDGLCEQILCRLSFLNGKVEDGCRNVVGGTCNFECDTGYKPTTTTQRLTCNEFGQWNLNLNTLCEFEFVCPLSFHNGKMEDGCSNVVGGSCSFECDTGYIPTTTTKRLTCNENGQWNLNITLCEFELVPSTSKEKPTDKVPVATPKPEKVSGQGGKGSKSTVPILAACLGLFVVVVVIVLLFIFLRRRRKNRNPADTQQIVNTPNNNPQHEGGAVIGIPNPLYACPTDYDYMNNACAPPEYTPSPPPHYEVPVDAPALPEKTPLPQTVQLEATSDTVRYLNSPGATSPDVDHTYDNLHTDDKEGFEKGGLTVELKEEADA
ncbi:low-density lipoprotein receptor-related protein 6-like isoform X2 [Glandiceps talaboti]